MPSVVSLIHEIGERHATRPALVRLVWDEASHRYYREASTSYAELYEQVLRLADALATRGLHAGDRVAVLLDNSVEMVVSEWACLVSGLVWVALNVRSSAAEHEAILADCAPSVLIFASHYRTLVEDMALPERCGRIEVGGADGWDALLASADARRPAHEPGPEDAVRIRYTSGTAGLPKGAVLPRRCYDASVEVVGDVIGPLREGDVLAQMAPMTHAAGAMWLPHAAVGATALLADRFDAKAFVELAVREGVTSAFLVPTMLVRFLEAVGEVPAFRRPSSLRSIVYGGAAMPVDRIERGLELLGPVFVQIYGLTESNWPVTALRREEHVVDGSPELRRRRLASCGRPTAVGELRIVVDADGDAGESDEVAAAELPGDEPGTDGDARLVADRSDTARPRQLRDASPGEAGEVLVRGRNTMLGYWRGGHGDAKGLDDEGWMHTGDIAIRDADGFVTIVDRLHDMIVSGGFNVYPREVEDALSSHPAVLEAAVVGHPDAEWGESVHAVVVLRPGAAATEKELADHVAALTAPYKKPRSFRFVAELPKNASGKVLRRDLKRRTPPA